MASADNSRPKITMDINAWIAHIGGLRATDELLARGRWTGYINDPHSSSPLRGNYVLARWKSGSVVIAHDDPERVIELARVIEISCFADDGTET